MKKIPFKKILYICLGIVFVLCFVSAILYLINSNRNKSEEFLTRKPVIQKMEDKVMATGKIVPKEEIEIKPNMSGIIDKILVKEGDNVTVGQLIATIRIVPNISELNNAQQSLNNANLQINNAKTNLQIQSAQYNMQKKLYSQGVISKQEYLTAEQQYQGAQQELKNAQQAYTTAEKSLQIAKTGATPELQSFATTQIRSKANGTVLEVPVKVGTQVIEANAFNPGTTICSIADLNYLIFKGNIDEAQAGKIKEGMEMNVLIGALQQKSFEGKVTLIAPKGVEESGTIKFPIEGEVLNHTKEYIRAGFSANGEIILRTQKNALILDESLVQYEKVGETDQPFVEVKQPDGTFKNVNVQLGISDGVNVQILSGIDKNAEVKVWNPSREDKEELKNKRENS